MLQTRNPNQKQHQSGFQKRNPNQNNPMMNVMLPEIQDNPNRKEAAPSYNKSVEKLINKNIQNVVKKNFNDEKIDERLFNDLGDKIQFESSMRQFFTNPNSASKNLLLVLIS